MANEEEIAKRQHAIREAERMFFRAAPKLQKLENCGLDYDEEYVSVLLATDEDNLIIARAWVVEDDPGSLPRRRRAPLLEGGL